MAEHVFFQYTQVYNAFNSLQANPNYFVPSGLIKIIFDYWEEKIDVTFHEKKDRDRFLLQALKDLIGVTQVGLWVTNALRGYKLNRHLNTIAQHKKSGTLSESPLLTMLDDFGVPQEEYHVKAVENNLPDWHSSRYTLTRQFNDTWRSINTDKDDIRDNFIKNNYMYEVNAQLDLDLKKIYQTSSSDQEWYDNVLGHYYQLYTKAYAQSVKDYQRWYIRELLKEKLRAKGANETQITGIDDEPWAVKVRYLIEKKRVPPFDISQLTLEEFKDKHMLLMFPLFTIWHENKTAEELKKIYQ